MSRALGVDFGQRRIGLALSDPDRMIAQAFQTITHHPDLSLTLAELSTLIDQHDVTQVVVGWPLRLNGREGIQTRRVQQFIDQLSQHISAPISRWDERLSTVTAERVLTEGKVNRRRRRAVVDQIAATLILQGWLDLNARKKETS